MASTQRQHDEDSQPWRAGAWWVAAAYTLLAVAWTWPLARGLGRDLPWDLGDPLLNCWILAWHFHQAGRVLRGDLGAFADWWHPNIFHPSPYGLGQSELLITQAVMGAPVYAVTGNILLTYDLLFLSSFVLAALGAYLLVRSLTRSQLAGVVAGLLYGFALYRVNQGPHLQVLSSQWFPFVLWGLHEWWERGRMRAAILAGLALAAQNLSNGYFLVYAALWLPIYVVAQVLLRRRLGDWRAWLGPLVTAAVGVGLTAPFLYPYLQLRRLGQPPRPLAAVVQYSADSYAWLTANDQLRLWSTHLQTLVRPEGDLFPGLVPIVLALIGQVLIAVERARTITDRRPRATATNPRATATNPRATATNPRATATNSAATASTTSKVGVALGRHDGITNGTRGRNALAWVAGIATLAHVVAILLALFAGEQRFRLGPVTVSITDGARLLVGFAVSLGVWLLIAPRARAQLRDEPQRPVVLWLVLAVLTVWLSLGPIVHIGGRTARTWPSLYAGVYAIVPGADGLRVPPRIAMVTALALAVLGGLAVAELARRRGGAVVAGVLAAAFVAESWPAPVPVNLRIDPAPLQPLVEPVPPRPADHPLAQAFAALPPDAVIVDLPFGSLPYEVWWQYLSIGHWRARVNGYSGDVPPGFLALDQQLGPFPDHLVARPDAAATEGRDVLEALRARGTTHVAVHGGAWPSPATAEALTRWLASAGATPVSTVGATRIWRLHP
ncbi:6-pyruvoyl-tetrahydropterin synthase-related protein [Luteitalea sp. TBR-22]|uniref:6-pyruvoyl-tetrahydropterin synthase-related protein n=1 Tax=Luteitalea sp. TBR-22 TaxID=2802971 RepID=UPI001EF697E2|nr:6-pyruvoyl-tetrahydropterin synthase-related protein [Luteitalea sp. TBR-22]